MRGIIQLLVHFAPVPPSARLPRPSVLHATRSARGDMWAPLGRQKLRRRHLAAVSHAAGQAARAVRRSPTSRRFERARSRASAARALCAPLCSAAAAVLDDDLTLTSAASSSSRLAHFLCYLATSSTLISQQSTPISEICVCTICDICVFGSHVTQ
eukprot:scaffold85934_cov68-Phaeocystis_antarctica.AAC.2